MDELYYDTFGWDYDVDQEDSNFVDHLRTCSIYDVPCDSCRELDALCYTCMAKLKRHACQCRRNTRQAKKASQEKTITTCFTDHKASTDFEAQPFKRSLGIAAPPLSSRHEFRSRLSMPGNALDQYWRLQTHQSLSAGNYSMVQIYEEYHFTELNDKSDTYEPHFLPVGVFLKPPVADYVSNIMIRRSRLVQLPYITCQGIGRTVYTLSYMRSTTHAIGVWASCEDDSWLRIKDWFEKKRRLVKTEGVIGALFGIWKLTQFDVD
ncbi:hypothetical protein F4815DRAFT_504912 [Daldinia loculata]|nr:hypothetical protein F4815DRAFT_504912 [Daldinia loculata]